MPFVVVSWVTPMPQAPQGTSAPSPDGRSGEYLLARSSKRGFGILNAEDEYPVKPSYGSLLFIYASGLLSVPISWMKSSLNDTCFR
jgi:hypothetical protein